MEFSSQGMPSSGRIGFEIFDRTAFGATEFLEKVNYRRALEGEIARTIATLSEVSSARVHIAMGKDSLFGESRPAKASVVLKLRGQRQLCHVLDRGHLEHGCGQRRRAAPESVVILDSFGRPLARPQEDDGRSARRGAARTAAAARAGPRHEGDRAARAGGRRRARPRQRGAQAESADQRRDRGALRPEHRRPQRPAHERRRQYRRARSVRSPASAATCRRSRPIRRHRRSPFPAPARRAPPRRPTTRSARRRAAWCGRRATSPGSRSP